MTRANRNIVLIGFMGSGKSEVGRRIAELTGRPFVDTDELVERDAGPIPEIFEREGEDAFRRRERKAVHRAAKRRGAVIATGGGAVLDPGNVRALKEAGDIVYLELGLEELTRRLKRAENRPLLGASGAGRRKRIAALLEERGGLYRSVADQTISCDGLTAGDVAKSVVERVSGGGGVRAPARRRGSTPLSRVRIGIGHGYDVHVGRGTLGQAGSLLPFRDGAERVCIVTHPRIRRRWGAKLTEGLTTAGFDVSWFTFPEGEANKTIETAERLWRHLARGRFHRNDALIAFGGGVVGDVTGFVAAGYARGMPYAQVPTTLLAMVDAAIGGKTGVNLPEGKNLVGAFHQPATVIADLEVLSTLPDRELRGGLAEVVKYGLIADPGLGGVVAGHVDEIFARGPVVDRIVTRSAAIKGDIVAQDERESGLRTILNYGHTLGHALEAVSFEGGGGSGRRPRHVLPARPHHGEAIAVGMLYAAWVAVLSGVARPDLTDAHEQVLHAVGLPTRVAGVSWRDVRPFIAVDKKYARGVRLVLLREAGAPVVHGDLPEQTLREAFDRVTAE